MRIDSASIGMDSARTYSSREYRAGRTTAYFKTGGSASGMNLFGNLVNTGGNSQDDEVTTQEKTKKDNGVSDLRETFGTRRAAVSDVRTLKTGTAGDVDWEEQLRQIMEECINYLLRLFFPDRELNLSDSYKMSFGSGQSIGSTGNTLVTSYTNEYYFEEFEDTSFSTQGTVRCADGREIDFNLNLEMSRGFQEYYAEEIQQPQAVFCDPLIINLEGNIPELSDQTFYFDIDSDGVEDEISRLIAGSGFLALDLNDDGIINDGSELFGTKSGDGFEDLAQYDTDGDGFIDEDDEIFDRLKIWAMNENGEMQLYSLKEKNVGAIGLKRADTQFALNSLTDNSTRGMIRKTGMFLYESGGAGTVQQVDFVKHNAERNAEMLKAYA